MSPRVPLLLNLLILVVNFVLLCAHADSDARVLRATTRAAEIPLFRPRWTPVSASGAVANRDTTPGARGAIGPIPHTRLLKFLARLDGSAELSGPQREAVYDALAHCCEALPRAARSVRSGRGDPRVARDRIEREVADRLRSARIRDEELARLVRVVVASAG